MKRFAAVLAAIVMATPAVAAPARWIAAWASSPTPPWVPPAGSPPNFHPTPNFQDQTVVQTVRLSAAGKRLQLRLSNEYGAKALDIGAVRVAVIGPDGKAGPDRVVTFAGAPTATIPAHAPLISDPVEVATTPLTRLKVAIYLPGDAGLCTCHPLGLGATQVSPPGDHTSGAFTPVSTTTFRPYLTEVDVEGAPTLPVIIAFGDSITDGHGSTVDANRRWPDILAERLKGKAAVVNAGISGNRVLSNGYLPYQGEGALSRFDRDVLSIPGATHLIVLEGVNDIAGRPSPTTAQMIAGYRQLIARAHAHGVKVYLATILPFGGPKTHPVEPYKTRDAINAWIRSNKDADGFVDFDGAIRDPADPLTMKTEWQSGDWLHPSDAGYRVMGEAVDLKLFR
ncbi:MAG TPA: SGNH/GDSL hydrolase family protein [Phenylobacterium sp.]|nr:SGNH/GDSL hydrolase family protein [Phenylobacterium sp.]